MDIYKYQAAGNDFIIIDSINGRADLSGGEIIRLCDRRYGIGADGLIIMEGSRSHDFSMRFYNNDGSSGMMCGNGGRCVIDLAWRSGMPASGEDGSWTFEAPDGTHRGKVMSHEGKCSRILLGMNDICTAEQILVTTGAGENAYAWKMNTGTDHLVIFREDLDTLDVMEEGRRWRYDPRFAPRGVNVNFAMILPDGSIRVRTYEKGVEYETLSCGTGIIAAAAATWLHGDRNAKYTLRSTRDTFTVSFSCRSGIFSDVTVEGPAELVFRATL